MENSKKTNVCCFSPDWVMFTGQLSLHYTLILILVFVLSVKVVQFNRERAAPDVSQEEHSQNFSVTSMPTETGFRYTAYSSAPDTILSATVLKESSAVITPWYFHRASHTHTHTHRQCSLPCWFTVILCPLCDASVTTFDTSPAVG